MTFENNPKVMLLWTSPLWCMSPACKYDQMKAVSAQHSACYWGHFLQCACGLVPAASSLAMFSTSGQLCQLTIKLFTFSPFEVVGGLP